MKTIQSNASRPATGGGRLLSHLAAAPGRRCAFSGIAGFAAAASSLALSLGLLLLSLAPLAAQQPAKPAQPAATPAATAAPAANVAPVRNIRFQFEGISYGDVLERFAQMANKPLLADTNIQGTLTFNDPNPYTYTEALDTLNLVLSMKGLMLVESGHYLRLVPFRELPAMPIRILRGSDSTGDVRPEKW
jgi:type II secretory pathway component GspD/PulD (secretin)